MPRATVDPGRRRTVLDITGRLLYVCMTCGLHTYDRTTMAGSFCQDCFAQQLNDTERGSAELLNAVEEDLTRLKRARKGPPKERSTPKPQPPEPATSDDIIASGGLDLQDNGRSKAPSCRRTGQEHQR